LDDGRRSFSVAAGTDVLRVALNADDDGVANFDLYVKEGSPPTTADFDCARTGSTQFHSCEFSAPAAGTWHVLVDRVSGSGVFQVTATSFDLIDCTNPANDGMPCNDGEQCTSNDVCQSGACAGTPSTGSACDDGDPCTSPDVCSAGSCAGTPSITACMDHFLCYQSTVFISPTPAGTIHLSDPFENVDVAVGRSKHHCTPADETGAGAADPGTHLQSYRVKSLQAHAKQTGVQVTNDLGTVSLDTIKAEYLLVPTAVDPPGGEPDPPPPPTGTNVDHYKCYKVKLSSGGFPQGLQVTVSDQFTSPAKTFDLKKPRHLCTAVDVDGAGVQNPGGHLLCYLAKPAAGQPSHVKQLFVQTNNGFGPSILNTVREKELCIPSSIGP
jgi:hypothetical protein